MTSKEKSILLIVLIIILSIFLIFVIVNTTKIIYQKKQVDRQIDELEKEVRNFEQKNQNLIDLIQKFQDPAYLEKEARKNLNLQKENENVVIILKDNKTSLSNGEQKEKQIPNYKKWIKYILGLDK